MKISPTESLGLLFLSFASGSTDVLAFLKLGDVFTSGMTGNVALMAIAISQGHMMAASRSLTAFIGFLLGAAVTTMIYNPDPDNIRRLPRLRSLFILEMLCLGSFIWLWAGYNHDQRGLTVFVLILLSAVGMGIQGVAARNLGPTGISTIVFTSSLISIVISLTNTLMRRTAAGRTSHGQQQLNTFVAYAIGAIFTGILIVHEWVVYTWMPLLGVTLALACYEASHRSQAGQN